jgi:hypothetical protein
MWIIIRLISHILMDEIKNRLFVPNYIMLNKLAWF